MYTVINGDKTFIDPYKNKTFIDIVSDGTSVLLRKRAIFDSCALRDFVIGILIKEYNSFESTTNCRLARVHDVAIESDNAHYYAAVYMKKYPYSVAQMLCDEEKRKLLKDKFSQLVDDVKAAANVLHREFGVIHCDIKVENVMYDDEVRNPPVVWITQI
jgi:hypothetical protein